MPNVHILSPDLISKIAAGEVIERPASVIKELIENSLDAGTQTIELHVEDAGKKLIRLRDTGHGIAKDDLETIFQRHATSKIQSYDDLFDIHSLGFRGEALYSIGAVSDVILRSKIASDQRSATSDQTGWELHIRGGKRLELKPAAAEAGTEIEVRELFFNTPARRKFLKSNVTEINQILAIFTPYTLLYPQCRFTLTHNDKTLVALAPAENWASRMAAALNLEEKNLLDASTDFPDENIKLRMILGDINLSRSRRDLQFIFVNGRPVQNKNIGFHLNEAYRLILPPHTFPVFAIYISLPPQDVDVNIHPAKREVKIKDEQQLCSALRRMVENALMTGSSTKQTADLDKPLPLPKGFSAGDAAADKKYLETNDADFAASRSYSATEQNTFPREQFSASEIASLFSPAGAQERQGQSLKERLRAGIYIGSFINKFLLFESGRSLLVVDQHAAQERITFEKLIQQLDKGKVEVQQLLSPIVIKLAPADMVIWEEAQKVFEELGFGTTQFDKGTIAVHSHPALVKDVERSVRDLLAGDNPARCDHESLARRACRGSVMAGDPLQPVQAQHIREQLLACRDPFICPHGRPTVIELTESFLNKQFLRT